VAEPDIRIGVVDQPISAEQLASELMCDRHGATVTFEGRVRDRNRGREVVGLLYEAYRPMAEDTLHEIAAEAAERFGADAVAALHRTGSLAVGDVSIAIAVSSAHRGAAFDAARYIIEQVKLRLPVWKQERYADGTIHWLDGVTPETVVASKGREEA
jgi:molybdopterin synthase catalytic subunit